MLDVVYIGDETTALGYRLAGLRVLPCKPEEAAERLAEAREETDLVLIGAGVAAAIPGHELAQAQAAGSPLVLVVPEVTGAEPPDFAVLVNRAFGLES